MTLKTARYVKIVGPSKDKGPYKLLEVESDGNPINAYIVESSGFASGPMTDGIGIAFPIAGDEGKVVVIPLAPAAMRYDGLKESEVKVGNIKAGSDMFFDENGNVIIKSAGGGTVHINPPG